jgi:RNA polymerase sigma-70 factor (ECF subfamily)
VEFEAFDEHYLEKLKSGDFRTQQHFVSYFSHFAQLKFGKRLRSTSEVEDARQETFLRFFKQLHKDGIREPKRLGAYVNGICNRILLERFNPARHEETSVEEDAGAEIPDPAIDAVQLIVNRETQETVREILDTLPDKHRLLIQEVIFNEEDRDEVCRKFGVSRENLRVLLHRAIKSFESGYLKRMRRKPPVSQ